MRFTEYQKFPNNTDFLNLLGGEIAFLPNPKSEGGHRRAAGDSESHVTRWPRHSRLRMGPSTTASFKKGAQRGSQTG